MIIRQANENEQSEIVSFYEKMCEVLDNASFLPDGNKGGFPSIEMITDAIHNKELFVGIENDGVMAAYIMNHQCDCAYDTVKWQINSDRTEVSVLHALRVLPEYSGRGYAKRLVEHAIQKAKENGQKAIRLDCIEGNDVPQKMYLSYGFKHIDTIDIVYEDIGREMKFLVFELLL